MNPLVALVVFGVACLLLVTTILVGRMRARHKIMAPATAGHPMFERAYRVQMNTIEQAVIFLPAFLLAAHFGRSDVACVLGAIWLFARLGYLITYMRNPGSRAASFVLGMLAVLVLLGQAGWGIVQQLMA
jgi:uncharacterized MAPEG superfamily protein